MSHITTVRVEIDDLNALQAAANELGATLIRDKKKYVWYGRHVGDYPLPEGMQLEDLGKCDHVVKIPGVNYEVGVVKKKNGKYTLAFDFFGHEGSSHDGHKLQQKFGDGCNRLAQLYSVHKATLAARAKGYSVQRKAGKNGNIQLVVTGV